jgi:hypothetical protein
LRSDCADLSRMITGLLKSISPNTERRTEPIKSEIRNPKSYDHSRH